jgi:hypothetical protein
LGTAGRPGTTSVILGPAAMAPSCPTGPTVGRIHTRGTVSPCEHVVTVTESRATLPGVAKRAMQLLAVRVRLTVRYAQVWLWRAFGAVDSRLPPMRSARRPWPGPSGRPADLEVVTRRTSRTAARSHRAAADEGRSAGPRASPRPVRSVPPRQSHAATARIPGRPMSRPSTTRTDR